MGLIEREGSSTEEPQGQPQASAEDVNAAEMASPTPDTLHGADETSNSEEEAATRVPDPFWDRPYNGSDAQLITAVTLHVGHEIAHEVKDALKSWLGIR